MTKKTRLDKLENELKPKAEEQREEMISFIFPINEVYGIDEPDKITTWPKSRYDRFNEMIDKIYGDKGMVNNQDLLDQSIV